MAKVNKLTKANTYNVEQNAGETLEHYYRRLAKSADQRLVRLEKYSNDKYFKVATDWAYSSAMRDIHTWNGQTATRFNTAPPSDPEKLIAKINDIKKFLSSPTSTKSGIKNTYIKKANTINKKYKTNFTWDQLAAYYDKKINEKWDAKFGSKTALLAIGRINEKANELGKDIEEVTANDFKGDKTLVGKKLAQNLGKNGLTIKDLV